AEAHAYEIAVRNDRLFAGLLVLEWVAAVVVALVMSPRTWAGAESHVHPHVWTALFFGAFVAVPAAFIALKATGSHVSRHVIGVAQMLMGALLIHVTGG